jgi:hypothetical protein
MAMNRAEPMFQAFREVSSSSLPKVLEFPLHTFSPRNSKALTTNLVKDINSVNEPRLLVLTGHLYFDYILEKMLDRETNNLTPRQKESFYAKLEFLNDRGRFDSQTYQCLTAINKLRNSFAHDIFYDLAEWKPTVIPYVQRYYLRAPKRKSLLRAFNIILLRLSFFAMLDMLTQQNRWLYLEDVPKP